MKTLLFFVGLLGLTACHWKDFDDHHEDSWGLDDRIIQAGPSSCPDTDCPPGHRATYLGADSAACAAITFECPEGSTRFDSACGCGCELPAEPTVRPGENGQGCPDGDDVLYLSREHKVCEKTSFSCPDGQARFDSDCGCGCQPACPDPGDPWVHYLSEDPEVCGVISFQCPVGCIPFDDRCGCGCLEPELPTGSACPDPDDPNVRYVSTEPNVCRHVTLSCPAGSREFDDACGCGCVD